MTVRGKRRGAREAFTLMEMLVVVAILVVLAGVGGYYYLRHIDESKVTAAKLQVKTLTDAVDAYKVKHGEYPASLVVLTERDSDGSLPYVEPDALKTPFGQQYGYDPSGPNNSGIRPDIWADTPQGRVGNWPQR